MAIAGLVRGSIGITTLTVFIIAVVAAAGSAEMATDPATTTF